MYDFTIFLTDFGFLKILKMISTNQNALNMHLQDLYSFLKPPDIGIKDEYICINPLSGMFFNCLNFDCPILYMMVEWIVAVRLNQKWSPIEIN